MQQNTNIEFIADISKISANDDSDLHTIRDIVSDDPLTSICLTDDNRENLTTPLFVFPLFATLDRKIIGVIDGQDLNSRLMFSEPENIKKLWDNKDIRPILYCIERSRVAILHWLNDNNINRNDVYYICSLGTTRLLRQRGIAKELAKQQIERLKEIGATHIVVETTGSYSRRIFQSLGFNEINFVNYKQMQNDIGCNEIQYHNGCATLVINL